MSAIHGIRDANRLDSAAFFALAVRLPAYQGAVSASAAAEYADAEPDDEAPAGRPVPARAGSPDDDLRARFAAAQRMPVASAADLAGITARASMPGQPAGKVTQVPASP